MALDTDRWLKQPIVFDITVPPKGIWRCRDTYHLRQEYVPELKFFPEERFNHYASNLGWNQQKLDAQVTKGNIVPAMVDVYDGSPVHIKSGFRFSDKPEAQREYRKFLGEVARAFDFSELD